MESTAIRKNKLNYFFTSSWYSLCLLNNLTSLSAAGVAKTGPKYLNAKVVTIIFLAHSQASIRFALRFHNLFGLHIVGRLWRRLDYVFCFDEPNSAGGGGIRLS